MAEQHIVAGHVAIVAMDMIVCNLVTSEQQLVCNVAIDQPAQKLGKILQTFQCVALG